MPAERCFQPLPIETRYSLRGPQVQPDASYWHTRPCRPLCIVRPEDLDCRVRRYPRDPNVIAD